MDSSIKVDVTHVTFAPGVIEIDPPYADDDTNTVRTSMYVDTDFGHGYVRLNGQEVSALIDALTAVKAEIDRKTTIKKLRGF